jgi:hypothetical protein
MPSRKLALLPAVLLVTQAHAVTNAVNYNVTGYDVAPDLSKYKFDPYPPLKDDKGNQFDAANVRGTRLFGYDGCDSQATKIINAAYDDFYKLSHLDGLYKNFNWKGQAAKEFWGSDVSPKAPLDDVRKEEIQRMCTCGRLESLLMLIRHFQRYMTQQAQYGTRIGRGRHGAHRGLAVICGSM